jgi:hypothetical protein
MIWTQMGPGKKKLTYTKGQKTRGDLRKDKIRELEVEARQMKKSQGLLDIHCNENPI